MKKTILLLLIPILLWATGCQKDEYTFGQVQAPTELSLNAVVVGTSPTAPNGDGTGNVRITATSKGALTYRIDYGDGITETVPEGNITHRYSTPGTNNYTITVNAIGTGGAISTVSRQVRVLVNFVIPQPIIDALTGGTSRVWVTDKDANAHFGIGPGNEFAPIWYAAGPNSREACAYDDEITFARNANNTISMTVDNKGASFSIGAATAFYGLSGGDNCYSMSAGGTKLLAFANASSSSTPAQSTRVQFTVPGNGIINFGTGGVTYEILSATATSLHLRNIGIDGNAWYQKFKVK